MATLFDLEGWLGRRGFGHFRFATGSDHRLVAGVG